MEAIRQRSYLDRTRGAAHVDVLRDHRIVIRHQQRRSNEAAADLGGLRAQYGEGLGEDVDEDQMLEAHVSDRHDGRQRSGR